MTENSSRRDGRRYQIGFSVVGSALIIIFFAFINFTTGVRFPWFIFPSYAAVWWPIFTIFIGSRRMKLLSIIGSSTTVAFLFFLNYITSWGYPWFVFPSFAILWWPIAMYFGASHARILSVIGCSAIIVMLTVINLLTTPQHYWFHYPVFAIIWWPLSVFLFHPKTIKCYSAAGAAVCIAYLTIINILESPEYLWAPLAYFPLLMWPAAVLLGKRLGRVGTAVCGCAAGIAYYAAMNIWLFPGFSWAIFPAYALLWWPLAAALAKGGRSLPFSVAGATLSAAFFITVNAVTSPGVIWAVYPIFALAWWPLSVYYFIYRYKFST